MLRIFQENWFDPDLCRQTKGKTIQLYAEITDMNQISSAYLKWRETVKKIRQIAGWYIKWLTSNFPDSVIVSNFFSVLQPRDASSRITTHPKMQICKRYYTFSLD